MLGKITDIKGHKISKSRIEVDRAKVDVIAKLPHPTTVKGVLLLQEFDITILDKKGSENLAADHLSRLENPHKDVLENKDINEHFPLETFGVISTGSTPMCVSGHEAFEILKACHEGPTGGHHSANLTARKLPLTTLKRVGQVEVLNRGLKRILERTVRENLASWSDKLDDALWERMKKHHDSKIKNRIFNVGDQVLLLNSRLKIFSGKLKTHWSGPFTIAQVIPYGTVELSQPDGPNFKVNGHHVKHYFEGDIPPKVVPDLHTLPKDN
ncbi:hypothetical protein Tco_0744932 [Tanacetum coccineum]